MDIIIFIFLCYQNYIRAKRIGLNPTKWVLYTLGALFLGIDAWNDGCIHAFI